jgi:RNA methyltransferase, TrmH family
VTHPKPSADEPIRSRQNPRVQEARRLAHDPRLARREGILVADGTTVVREALAAGLAPRMILLDPDDDESGAIVAQAGRRDAAIVPVTRKVIEAVSTLAAPQGAIGIFERPRNDLARVLAAPHSPGPPLIAVLHGLQDPSNAGSLIRTALAAGLAGMVATEGTVDPWHVRAIRGSMGAAFRLPIAADVSPPALWETLQRGRYRLLALSPRGDLDLADLECDQPTAIVLGREGSGLDPDVRAACGAAVRIPMAPGVESLGVAAAGAVVFYAWMMRGRTRG